MINCFIPIKSYSERVKNKNFLNYKGDSLYTHIIKSSLESNAFDNVFIDTDSEEVSLFASSVGCKVIERKKELASNLANGNDLLNYHSSIVDSDYYFQLFATAPNLKPDSITKCVETLVNESHKYDSIFTVQKDYGWYWFKGLPVNYRPSLLPRSQDSDAIFKETTGLYGITRESLLKYKCRIGLSPYMYELQGEETKDIDWEQDLK